MKYWQIISINYDDKSIQLLDMKGETFKEALDNLDNKPNQIVEEYDLGDLDDEELKEYKDTWRKQIDQIKKDIYDGQKETCIQESDTPVTRIEAPDDKYR